MVLYFLFEELRIDIIGYKWKGEFQIFLKCFFSYYLKAIFLYFNILLLMAQKTNIL